MSFDLVIVAFRKLVRLEIIHQIKELNMLEFKKKMQIRHPFLVSDEIFQDCFPNIFGLETTTILKEIDNLKSTERKEAEM